ncbi:MAG: HAD hydrolase-like protein [Chloroflexota bacterium]
MLVLFDIDGTLLHTGGLSKALFFQALEDTFGVRPERLQIPWQGLTDYGIACWLLRHHHVSDSEMVEGIPAAFERLDILWQAHGNPDAVTVYPGVIELLAELQGISDVQLGYFTANCRSGAENKLFFSQLEADEPLFPIRLAGDTVETKVQVLEEGLAHDVDLLNSYRQESNRWILGDSPADMICAHAHGFQGLGVATGFYDQQSLAEAKPSAIFPNFSQPHIVLNRLLRN